MRTGRSRGLIEDGDAEVEYFDPAVPRDEDVVGLQVPVHDPAVVRGCEAAGDLHAVSHGFRRRKRASRPETDAEGLALEQLCDDEVRRALGADIVNGENVRMIQRGDRTRLALETCQRVDAARDGREDLDRDVAGEPGIVGAVDFTHAAGAKGAADFIRAEPCARLELARFRQQLLPQRAVERPSRLQDRILVVVLTQELLDRTPDPGIVAAVRIEKCLARVAWQPQRLIEERIEFAIGIHGAPLSGPGPWAHGDVRARRICL
jgi:hypothetical protein